ncbi:16288_t:CDS:2 [Racocetra fulgida]|uniref:16287_t:CDS:1 n=1 Tax=Racocetra fulgida TaxID=60492 RepID=A0A9N8WSZ9_9GLOM|nr:16287_t:CDS:2 [Racocetra fulgida]CAG8494944.1 16288_t:CDS:2 [Racocetra fulgida]
METSPGAHKSTLVRTIHETDIIDSSEVTNSKDIDVETDNSNVKKRKLSDQIDSAESNTNRQISKQIIKKDTSDIVVCYYENGEKGLITINGQRVTPETIIKNQDLIGHRLHRHEPPVTANPIKILCVKDDHIVIDKPSSIPVHRLTSGIMILSSKKEKAQDFERQLKNRKIQKEYICRVLVHLQYLGHPIANDPLYANAKAWGSELGKGGINAEQTDIIIDKLIKEGFCENGDMSSDTQKKTDDCKVFQTNTGDDLKNEIAKLPNENNHAKESVVIAKPNMKLCEECTAAKFSDPFLHQLLIWLHALKYEGDGWKYESELPFWAKDEFVGDMEYV